MLALDAHHSWWIPVSTGRALTLADIQQLDCGSRSHREPTPLIDGHQRPRFSRPQPAPYA